MGCALVALLAPVTGCEPSAGGTGVEVAPDSASCGSCHAEQYTAWRSSSLSQGSDSPVFAALVEHVEADWGAAAAARCVRCHEPGFGGADDRGIGCVACHGAVGMREARDGLLRIDLQAPLGGPFGDTDAGGAHGTRHSGLLRSAQLCGSCHEVSGPGLLVETTWSEFLASPQAAAGQTCIDCHMPELADGPITTLGDSPSRARRDHSFVGLDPPWHAPPLVAARAAERTRTLLAAALTLELTLDDTHADTRAIVSLENVGAAHAVPTGVSMLRDLWVDLRVLDAHGTERWRSARVLELGGRLLDGELEVALLTHADRIEDASLGAGERREVTVALPQLAREDGAVVEATLHATAFQPALLEALGLEALDAQMPRHEVATARVVVSR